MVWLPGAVSVEFHDVPQRHFSHVTLYILIHFRSSTQKSNTNLNNLFYMNITFDKLMSEIDNIVQKGEFHLNVLKEFSFSYIYATSRNNV